MRQRKSQTYILMKLMVIGFQLYLYQKYPSTGELQESYIFSEAWGEPKWKSVLEDQASGIGIRIIVSSPTPPKFEYIPCQGEKEI